MILIHPPTVRTALYLTRTHWALDRRGRWHHPLAAVCLRPVLQMTMSVASSVGNAAKATGTQGVWSTTNGAIRLATTSAPSAVSSIPTWRHFIATCGATRAAPPTSQLTTTTVTGCLLSRLRWTLSKATSRRATPQTLRSHCQETSVTPLTLCRTVATAVVWTPWSSTTALPAAPFPRTALHIGRQTDTCVPTVARCMGMYQASSRTCVLVADSSSSHRSNKAICLTASWET